MIVSFTVSGVREAYLRRALDSWSQARDISQARLLFFVEPARSFPVADFTRWVKGFPCQAEVYVNEENRGILENTRQAFAMPFGMGEEFVILAEEDIVVADDVLSYFSWAQREYQGQDVTMVCAHSKEATGEPWQVTRASWFSPLVCGTWKDKWDSFIGPTWSGLPPNDRGVTANESWDANLRSLIHESGRQSLFPVLSRSNHIGEQSTWTPPAIASYLYPASTSQSFQPAYSPQEYREVGFNDVPRLIV